MDLISSWEGCMSGYTRKVRSLESWAPPEQTDMKLNVDGEARGKPGPARIGGELRNHDWTISIMFSELVGIRDSNEVEILNIRRALTIWKIHGQRKLVKEGGWKMRSNGLRDKGAPLELITMVRDIKDLVSGFDVSFVQIGRIANRVADYFAKLGVTD